MLATYLDDHLAGASAGLARFRSAAAAERGTPAGEVLGRLADEVAQDVQELESLVEALHLPRRNGLRVLAVVAERVGRLKPNGRLRHRSPLSALIDLEGLVLGVTGKAALWRALRALADHDDRLDRGRLEALTARAERQVEELETLRRAAAVEALRPDRPPPARS
ncbi:hypothetical protein GTR02_02350 [Kineococcus sp. R8]|nr:hypothetical protein [Kineococcus siccus]